MDENEFNIKRKFELKEAASKLLLDEINFIEGIRAIHERLDVIILDEKDVNVIRGIDSDTDDTPIGDTRKLWNQESLMKNDEKLLDYIENVKPQVKEVCKKILKIIEED